MTAPLFAPPSIVAELSGRDGTGNGHNADGGLLLRSTEPLGDYPATVMHSVRGWAEADPGHPLVAERRAGGDWRICGYGETVAAADAIGQAITEMISPGAVFADDASRFAAALDAIAKILFTSGSTGAPKGVLNSHRMLAANQQMIRQAWPFLAAERPVIVDWLPWSHTFGGNHNVNMMGVTDKGYVNQRRVLANRAALVDLLYAQPVPAGVVVAERTALCDWTT